MTVTKRKFSQLLRRRRKSKPDLFHQFYSHILFMYVSTTQARVRYAETDQMGIVYYGNYAQYFEISRVENMRQLGYSYKEMEKEGVILPVVEMHIKYLRSAVYDDLLTIR